jgi:hypothetical protein
MTAICCIIGSVLIGQASPAHTAEAGAGERPAWVERGEWMDPPVRYRVATSELWATPERARDDALEQARDVARQFAAESEAAPRSDWRVPLRVVEDELLQNEYIEKVDRTFGTMYRAHLLLALSPDKRETVLAEWNRSLAEHRLVQLGGGLGFLLVCLSAWLGYLRLDDATRGYYTPWLVALALGIVAGSGALVYSCVL